MNLLDNRRWLGLFAAAACCAAGVFYLNVAFDLGVAGGLLYVTVILIVLAAGRSKAAYVTAGICTALLVAESLAHADRKFIEILASRALGLMAVWATAAVGAQRLRTAETLRQAQQALEQRVAQRTAELAKANERLRGQMAERERAEQALREFEAMYHSLMETLPLNVFRKDLDGKVVLANQRHCETIGIPLEKLVGKTDFDLFPRELAEKYHRDDAMVIASGKMFEDVEQHRRPDGELIHVQVLKAPVRDAAGNIVGVQGMFWDVTARRRAEVSLLQERYLLRSVMDNLPDAMYFKDRNGRFIRINKTLADQFRLAEPSYAEGKTDFDFHTKEYAMAAAADERRILQTGQGFVNKEEREESPDGSFRWLSTTKMPLHDKDGKVVGTVGISRDITFRKQAEEALRENAEQTRLIIDTAYDAFVAMDADGLIIDWNPRAEAMFGWSREEALGRSVADTIVPERFREQHRRGLATFFATGEGPVIDNRIEIAALRRDGGEFTVEFTATPIRRGASWVFNAFLHDITRRKEYETELQKAKEAAEGASQAKSLFLANMSHEIRTPMNAVLGMTDLVLGTELSPLQRDYLAVVQESGESLLLIIDDILDFSKIEAGRLDLTDEAFTLADSLGDMMKLLALRAHSKGLELALRVSGEVPRVVVGDRARLRQIVVNLVGNAIKFTEHGEVVLDVSLERPRGGLADTADHNELMVHFAIRDTGVGIPAHKHDLIFEAFEQADNTNTRKFGGAGLGLAISSRLAKLMGGRIWLDSEVGRGSTFHFTVAFKAATDAEQAEAAFDASRLRGLAVLIVDDNATSRRIFDETIRHAGMKCATASGTYEALSLIDKARRAGTPFAAVVVDGKMPTADGFSLVEHLQRVGQLLPIVMLLSSGDRLGDVARCEAAGIRNYLIKPIKESELLSAILAAIADEAPSAKPSPAAATLAPKPVLINRDVVAATATASGENGSPRRPLNILLAEDSLVNQKLALGLLERQGHHVTLVNNGSEALSTLVNRRFDLVLMDVQMPILDGLSATRSIRSDEQRSGEPRLPIIALTAHAMKGDRELCLQAGMDGYVTKPVRAEELFQAIDRLIGGATTHPAVAGESASDELPSGSSPSVSPPAAHAISTSVKPMNMNGTSLDLSAAIEAVQGDRGLLKELIEAFLEECPGLVNDISAAVERGDGSALRLSAHRLKGSMRYFGATRAFDLAFDLESLGRDGQLAAAAEPLASVRDELDHLQPALCAYLAALN